MNQTVKLDYEIIIGLEVHLQLDTQTKIFCGCLNEFGKDPNTNTCPVCLGLPGSLPVVNERAIEFAIKIGHALNCTINSFVKFDRKNYFYPDCPKNYQISQFDYPICSDGHLMVTLDNEKQKRIGITRAHLEEDAGKLIHDKDGSLVDYNRTGTPLLEIVTEPDIRSAQEAYHYLQTLKLTLEYLDVSDCDMEKGSLRCDANISIREHDSEEFNAKTELKNMNSFKAVKSALEYEIERHKKIHDTGEAVLQETRLWDESKAMTMAMRSKEDAHDYRYFPEPDLVPFILEEGLIEKIRETLPELPQAKMQRLIKEHNISEYDARIIVQDRHLADFFEECTKLYKDTKKICNWLNVALLKELNERKKTIRDISLSAVDLAALIKKVEEGTISNLAGKEALTLIIDTGKSTEEIIQEKGLAQVSDDDTLKEIVDGLIKEHEKVANQIREGKESAVGFLVGQAMKKTQGKVNPKKIGEIIKRRLQS